MAALLSSKLMVASIATMSLLLPLILNEESSLAHSESFEILTILTN